MVGGWGEIFENHMRRGVMIFTPHQIEFGCANHEGFGGVGACCVSRVGEDRVLVREGE